MKSFLFEKKKQKQLKNFKLILFSIQIKHNLVGGQLTLFETTVIAKILDLLKMMPAARLFCSEELSKPREIISFNCGC